jgi:calcineurin-like phosphoesterase family protein
MLPFPAFDLDTWLVSDTHFGHAAMCRPDFAGRPLDHDRLMHDRWCEQVGRNDQLLHLGDLALHASPGLLANVVKRLPGKKFLLPGNHDRKPAAYYAELGFTLLDELLLEEFHNERGKLVRDYGFYWDDPRSGKRILLSHYPDSRRLDWDTNVHGHIHTNGFPAACPAGLDYRNISVEVVGFRPWRLREILDGSDGIQFQSRTSAGLHANER